MTTAKRVITAQLVIILCLFTALRTACAADTNINSIPALRAAIETVLGENKTPGAAVAIVSRDKDEWVAGIGKADVAMDMPVTPGLSGPDCTSQMNC